MVKSFNSVVKTEKYLGPEVTFNITVGPKGFQTVTDGKQVEVGGFNSERPVKEIMILPDIPLYRDFKEIYITGFEDLSVGVEFRTEMPVSDRFVGFITDRDSKTTIYSRLPCSEIDPFIKDKTKVYTGRIIFLDYNGELVKSVSSLTKEQLLSEKEQWILWKDT